MRQAFHALIAAGVLALASPSFAQSVAPVAPPTAEPTTAKPAGAAAAPMKPTPSWLAARPAPKVTAASGQSTPSSGRLLGGLLLLGALGGAAFYFKRRGQGVASAKLPQPRLSVLASARIGHKAHAVVISVSGRQMLLGVTEGSVKRLAFIDELADEESERTSLRTAPSSASRAAATSVSRVPAEPPKPGSFGDLLKTAFAKRSPAREADAASIIAAETSDTAFGRPVAGATGVRMLDVEGQAQGLIRRLSGPRA